MNTDGRRWGIQMGNANEEDGYSRRVKTKHPRLSTCISSFHHLRSSVFICGVSLLPPFSAISGTAVSFDRLVTAPGTRVGMLPALARPVALLEFLLGLGPAKVNRRQAIK